MHIDRAHEGHVHGCCTRYADAMLPLPTGIKESIIQMYNEPVLSFDKRDSAPEIEDCNGVRQAKLSRAGGTIANCWPNQADFLG